MVSSRELTENQRWETHFAVPHHRRGRIQQPLFLFRNVEQLQGADSVSCGPTSLKTKPWNGGGGDRQPYCTNSRLGSSSIVSMCVFQRGNHLRFPKKMASKFSSRRNGQNRGSQSPSPVSAPHQVPLKEVLLFDSCRSVRQPTGCTSKSSTANKLRFWVSQSGEDGSIVDDNLTLFDVSLRFAQAPEIRGMERQAYTTKHYPLWDSCQL